MGRRKKIEIAPEEHVTQFVCPICGKTFEDAEDLCFYIGEMQKTCSWKCFIDHIRSLPKVEKKPGRRKDPNSLTEAWASQSVEESKNN